MRSKDLHRFNPNVELEICDGFYESNRLEDAKRTLHDDLRLFSDTQSKSVRNRLNVVGFLYSLYAINITFLNIIYSMFQVTSNIQDALSDETPPAVHRLINNMIVNESKKPNHLLNECDVLSIAEKEVLLT